jgi:hypothetical protein
MKPKMTTVPPQLAGNLVCCIDLTNRCGSLIENCSPVIQYVKIRGRCVNVVSTIHDFFLTTDGLMKLIAFLHRLRLGVPTAVGREFLSIWIQVLSKKLAASDAGQQSFDGINGLAVLAGILCEIENEF